MSFGSDNQAPAHPAALAALVAANDGRTASYGADPWTARAVAALRETFEKPDLEVAFVAGGQAANGLALSLLAPGWAAVVAHAHAHILEDEGTGPEFFTGGARLIGLDGAHGKLTPDAVRAAAARYPKDFVHGVQPRCLSLTNATECGTVYGPDEIAALSATARVHGWGVHMDGARFANAVAGSGASPADLSWRSGVDILSLGLTKTGGLICEMVVVFDPARLGPLPYLQKRAGQLVSKQRFLAAPTAAMLEGGLWLDLAGLANGVARALEAVLAAAGCAVLHPVEANEVFARVSTEQADALRAGGVTFYDWPQDGPGAVRFVASWASTDADVEAVRLALG
jgi:threonine aldolase